MKRFEEEIRGWDSLLNALRADDRIVFRRMLIDLQKYGEVIGRQQNSSEALIIAILLQQHKLIRWLESEMQKLKLKLKES
jgi:hypothetical protein